MENDEFRMQNGGRKVAISGAPIDAQGCGLSPAESGSEHGIVSRGGHTAGNHLLPSSSIRGLSLFLFERVTLIELVGRGSRPTMEYFLTERAVVAIADCS